MSRQQRVSFFWPDDTVVRTLGPKMICTKCSHRGADVRPDWSPHVNKRHV
jgi:hypothetical protein